MSAVLTNNGAIPNTGALQCTHCHTTWDDEGNPETPAQKQARLGQRTLNYVVDEDEPDGGYVIYDEGRYEVTLFGEYETGTGVATFTEATEILRAAIAELHLHPHYQGVDIPCFYVRHGATIPLPGTLGAA